MKNYILAFSFLTLSFAAVPVVANATTAMELIDRDQQQPQIVVTDDVVRISGANNRVLQVYDIAGVCILTIKIDSPDKTINLSSCGLGKGCYIFKVGKTTRKISLNK